MSVVGATDTHPSTLFSSPARVFANSLAERIAFSQDGRTDDAMQVAMRVSCNKTLGIYLLAPSQPVASRGTLQLQNDGEADRAAGMVCRPELQPTYTFFLLPLSFLFLFSLPCAAWAPVFLHFVVMLHNGGLHIGRGEGRRRLSIFDIVV